VKVRLTAWLAESERQWVHDEATRLNTSDNYVIRALIREAMSHVTGVTRNTDREETHA
jgi:hypothetical protein